MRNLVVLTLFTLATITHSLAEDEHIKAGERMKRGQFKDALVLLDESVASHPDWWYPIYLKGRCYLKLKKYNDALGSFNDSLTMEVPSKDIPGVKYFISQTYMAMKDYPKAAKSFSDLLPLVPANRHFDLYFNRGQCEMEIAKASSKTSESRSYYSKAIVSFSEALKSPTSRNDLLIEAAFQKAYCQYKIGNYEGGITSLERSIKAFQDVIQRDAKEQRAHTFIINLQFEIIEKSPENRKKGEYLKVVKYIDNYMKNWPKDYDMLNKKGKAYQGAKDYKAAIDIFEEISSVRGNDAHVWLSLGSCQMADGQHKSALTSFKKTLSLGLKDDPRLYSYASNSYIKQKNDCDPYNIPLQKQALAMLEQGVKNLSGPARQAIQKEVNNTRQNLEIMESNYAADKVNHQSSIENVQKLKKTVKANTATLEKNQALYIGQPTEELKKAIDETRERITADRASLDKEFKAMEAYVRDAKKCGGSGSYPDYNKMVELLKSRE